MTIQRLLPSLVLLSLVATCAPTTSAQEVSDEDTIRGLIGDYIKGWREADAELLAQLFALEEGRVMWVTEQSGEQVLDSMTFGEIVQRRGRPQPEYGLEWKLLTLDVIDGKLAVAKVSISRKGGSYVDLLVWQKIGGVWQIVNKTFVSRTDKRDPQG